MIAAHCVAEVKRRAAVVEVVGAAVQLKKRGASWVGLCPFHNEKSPSLHVTEARGLWKCFGCGEGGDALAFVMKREGLKFTEAVEALAGRFGVALEKETRGPRLAPAAAAGGGEATAPGAAQARTFVLPAGADPRALRKAMAQIARRDASRRAADAIEEQRARALRGRVERADLPAWPGCVAQRFEEGRDVARTGGEREALAAERGWPTEWVDDVFETGLVAFPLLPWSDARRSVAWRVDVPELAADPGGGVVVRGLRAVGYHQRFFVQEKKQWLYVPYCPAANDGEGRTKRLNVFQGELRAVAAQRGKGEGDSLVQGAPFVMGQLSGVRRLLVAEGQWDAVTVAGACGWLGREGENWPEGTAVMGVRGASGLDTLLAWWREWLLWESPAVLVLADNDAAGRKWDVAEGAAPGVAPEPTLAQKLRAAGAARVVVSRVRREHGKDFNDYWRARRPGVAAMARWLGELGF